MAKKRSVVKRPKIQTIISEFPKKKKTHNKIAILSKKKISFFRFFLDCNFSTAKFKTTVASYLEVGAIQEMKIKYGGGVSHKIHYSSKQRLLLVLFFLN